MKKFTFTEFRVGAIKVLTEVQKSGAVLLVNRQRPNMVLMTQEELDKRIKEAKESCSA